MKTMKFFFLAAAVFAAISCVKETAPQGNVTSEVELVPMTFTASYKGDTKIAYEGGATVWKPKDEIMVISSNGYAAKFTATSVDGNIATFEGLTEKTETYYAVSPASAYVGNDIANGKIYANVPQTQTAVAGSFDPKAFLSVASGYSDELCFLNSCSVVGFSLANPEGVNSIRFTAAGQTNLAGTGTVMTNSIPTHRWDGEYSGRSAYDVITLNAPEGGFQTDTEYFLTIRANKCPNGISVYVEYDDDLKVRTGTSPLFPDKDEDGKDFSPMNKLRSLGVLDQDLADATPYESYMLGFDLNIAGRTYNKSLGNATRISDADVTISENGVYFIDASATNLKISKDGTLNKLYVIANTTDTKVPVTFGRDLRYGKNGTVAFKNMDIAQLTTSELFIHNNDNATSTLVALDGCKITMSGKSVITNFTTRTIDTFAMHNCDVLVTGNDSKIIAGGADITNVEFVNNIFFSDSARKNFKLYDITSGGTSNVTSFNFVSNSFINVYLNPNGLITPTSLKGSFINKQNLFEYPEYMTAVNSTYRTMLRCGDDVTNYPNEEDFVWEAGWFYIGQTEVIDQNKYGIKSSYKISNAAVSPKNTSGFTSLTFDPLKFTKANNAGATR